MHGYVENEREAKSLKLVSFTKLPLNEMVRF
jgi:hypothetical protein